MKGARFLVRGDVQGVGFRYFVLHEARDLGLAGWVRNLPDGDVEARAWGGEAELARFRAALERGPSRARVERVEETPLGGEPPGAGFHII